MTSVRTIDAAVAAVELVNLRRGHEDDGDAGILLNFDQRRCPIQHASKSC